MVDYKKRLKMMSQSLVGGVKLASCLSAMLLVVPLSVFANCPHAAEIMPEIAREPLDPSQGAIIELSNSSAPLLMTPATCLVLIYALNESVSLEFMSGGAYKLGDVQLWTQPITV